MNWRNGPGKIRWRIGCRCCRIQRARQVIERVAAMCGLARPERRSAPATAMGIAFARYKNRAAYAAVVVEVEVDEQIRLSRVWCAADAGLVINPDGAINQLEGGIIQAASWALKEQVRLEETGIRLARLGELSGAAVQRNTGGER